MANQLKWMWWLHHENIEAALLILGVLGFLAAAAGLFRIVVWPRLVAARQVACEAEEEAREDAPASPVTFESGFARVGAPE